VSVPQQPTLVNFQMTEEKALTRNRSIGYRVLAVTSDGDTALQMLESTSDLIADYSLSA